MTRTGTHTVTGTGTPGALTEPLPARIPAPAPGTRPGSLKKIPPDAKQCEGNAADPAAVPLERRPGPLEPVKRNIAEHPREPRPATLRDRCAIARHRGRCRKASHTVALNRRVSTSRAMPRDPQDIAISPARAISTRPPEPAHSGAPGLSHVRYPVPPWSRTPPANFAVFEPARMDPR